MVPPFPCPCGPHVYVACSSPYSWAQRCFHSHEGSVWDSHCVLFFPRSFTMPEGGRGRVNTITLITKISEAQLAEAVWTGLKIPADLSETLSQPPLQSVWAWIDVLVSLNFNFLTYNQKKIICSLLAYCENEMVLLAAVIVSYSSFLLLHNKYHKLSLKQCPPTILQSVGMKSKWTQGSLLIQGQNLGAIWAELLTAGPGGESAFKLIQIVGKISVSVAMGLRFPFLCWLSGRSHSHLLENICILCHMPPLAPHL